MDWVGEDSHQTTSWGFLADSEQHMQCPVCKSLLGGTLQEDGGIPRSLTIPFLSRFPVSGFLHSPLLRFTLGVSMGEKAGVTLVEKRVTDGSP